MAATQMTGVIQHLHRIVLADRTGTTDAHLLESFIQHRDGESLAALVRLHGPMVWGVCRRILRCHHAAEDAFQATFLVLVRKAASIQQKERVANWLYGVAHQTAVKARAVATARGVREKQVADMPEPAAKQLDLWNDLQPVLDQELSCLPEKYRVLLVLCDVEGMTRKEAARQLGCPEGTVAGNLARARVMLAKRLTRHGLHVSGGVLAAVLTQSAAEASVPASILSSTIKAATLVASGQVVLAGAISANVTALTEGVLRTMFLNKLKFGVATLVAVAFLVGGLLTAVRSSAVFAAPVPKDAAKAGDRKVEDIPQLDELVKNRKVVRELKCTAEQRVTIEDQFDDLDEAFEKREKAFNLLKPDNLDDLLEMLDAERKREIAKLAQKLVTTTFKPQQIERLHQIDLQTRGPVAFKDAKVAKALGLSDADKQRIAQAVDQFQDAADDLDEDDDIIKAARETSKAIVDGLTKEQQDAWKKMIGEPVSFEILERLTPDDE